MWSLIFGFCAMLLIGVSYFLTDKTKFLFFQMLGIVFLIASYLSDKAYFATVGMSVALVRCLVYFAYEKNNKVTPIWVAVVFSLLTILAYILVNMVLVSSAKPIDIVCLFSMLGYAIFFRIPDLKTMRYLAVLPISLAVVYNAFAGSAIFVVISYSFELFMSVLAIFKYQILNKKTEVTNENC